MLDDWVPEAQSCVHRQAFDIDNLLTNNCMLEKVLEALMPDIQSFFKA